VTLNLKFPITHDGYFTLKLCKLNSPKDVVNQSCFDQEILKISALNPINNAENIWLSQGDYVIQTGGGANQTANFT